MLQSTCIHIPVGNLITSLLIEDSLLYYIFLFTM